MKLPFEIIEEVALYIPFSKAVFFTKSRKLLKSYNEVDAPWSNLILENNLLAIKFLYINDVFPITVSSNELLKRSIQYGYLNIVKWFVENNIEFNNDSYDMDDSFIDIAVFSNQLDIVKYLNNYEKYSQNITHNAIDVAAEQGYLHIIIWLLEHIKTRPWQKYSKYALINAIDIHDYIAEFLLKYDEYHDRVFRNNITRSDTNAYVWLVLNYEKIIDKDYCSKSDFIRAINPESGLFNKKRSKKVSKKSYGSPKRSKKRSKKVSKKKNQRLWL